MNNDKGGKKLVLQHPSSLSDDIYGYLQHPSGNVLPKLLRSQVKASFEGDEDIDVSDDTSDVEEISKMYRNHHQINEERYWTVAEIIDMLNTTSQQILNVQTQIMNGEDYYVNNVSSISLYNTKNSTYDSTSFLDSINSNNGNMNSGGGNMTNNTNSSNSSNQQHRWFSSSFTNINPYRQTIPYPVVPKKDKSLYTASLVNTSASTTSYSTLPTFNISSTASDSLHPSTSLSSSQPVPSTSDLPTAISNELFATTVSSSTITIPKRGRSSNAQLQAATVQPTQRRTTKRRRKT